MLLYFILQRNFTTMQNVFQKLGRAAASTLKLSSRGNVTLPVSCHVRDQSINQPTGHYFVSDDIRAGWSIVPPLQAIKQHLRSIPATLKTIHQQLLSTFRKCYSHLLAGGLNDRVMAEVQRQERKIASANAPTRPVFVSPVGHEFGGAPGEFAFNKEFVEFCYGLRIHVEEFTGVYYGMSKEESLDLYGVSARLLIDHLSDWSID